MVLVTGKIWVDSHEDRVWLLCGFVKTEQPPSWVLAFCSPSVHVIVSLGTQRGLQATVIAKGALQASEERQWYVWSGTATHCWLLFL
jgi:hypothetical protein